MDERSELLADLMVAANVSFEIPRGSLCRLAGEPASWLAEGDGAALALGLPRDHLARLRALLPRAAALAGEERRRAAKRGCRIVTRWDEEYPASLLELTLPPPLLYVRGELRPAEVGVAVVGARAMDGVGRRLVEIFAGELASAGFCVVSGFARGVDTAAHRAALGAGGRTLAVLGCGLDLDYPRGSRALAEQIAGHGALISEFPLGAEPLPFNFPIRNRLIAALARVTLVVQAKARSGSLNTAHHALELGREVWAVPGSPLDPLAAGANSLIADGAPPALRPSDLIERLGRESPAAPPQAAPAAPPPPAPKLPGKAGELLELLGPESRGADDLADATGWPIDQVLGLLLDLELQGLVARRPGPRYARC